VDYFIKRRHALQQRQRLASEGYRTIPEAGSLPAKDGAASAR